MPSERRRDVAATADDFGQVRSYLARQGVSQATIKDVIGVGSQGRSQAEITAVLRAWMHDLPKAGTVAGAMSARMVMADEGVVAAPKATWSERAWTALKVLWSKIVTAAREVQARAAFAFEAAVVKTNAAVDKAMDTVVARIGRE